MATLPFSAGIGGFTINDNVTASNSIPAPFFGFWLRVVDLQVRLTGLSHAFPDDLDFLLVGPNGVGLEFWSDAGGLTDINGEFIIADSGASLLPNETAIAPGTYRPTDYETPLETSSNWAGVPPSITINHPAPG